MSSFHIFVSTLVVVAHVLGQIDTRQPCCHHEKIHMDVVYNVFKEGILDTNKTQTWTFTGDYESRMVYIKFHDPDDGITSRLFDGPNGVSYDWKKNGDCEQHLRKLPVSNCMPENSTYENPTIVDGHLAETWIHTGADETSVYVVRSEGCVPIRERFCNSANCTQVDLHNVVVGEGVNIQDLNQDITNCRSAKTA